MSIKNIFFDLDGTLLPMDQDSFIKTYLESLAEKMRLRSHDPEKFIDTVMKSTYLMAKNDGSVTNSTVFWNYYYGVYGDAAKDDEDFLEKFYREDFDAFGYLCGYEPRANELVKRLKDRGFRLVLATSPVFPASATECRIRWAGLDQNDFELVTTYENSTFCKPNPMYYHDIASRLGMRPDECLMIGNDALDDMAALEVGMKVFLLTDHLINRKNADISVFRNGDFSELVNYLDTF